ncbi:MAG: 50S ribosomal protein L17 [Bacteroidetes bacterium ADurb.Bin037]|nr:MAG: 50S ribosomal protein L17 [Bacteroidetes bacterium ADurb.Bin037]HPW78135.1 50S ribosomal protein L17 [Bacteroidales bacterium]HQB56634.1 50S ribosomal protein L17 [Bacteroidales bacterium]
MRHRKKINHLGRKAGHRKAMLANMASSLILHKRIETTVTKAKALRVYVEPLITKSKNDTTHSRRIVFSYLKNKYAVSELFRVVAPKVAERPGGYTRILKTGFRAGDAADMAMIELVDFNELALAGTVKKEEKKATRRSRAKTSKVKTGETKSTAEQAPATETAEVIKEKEQEPATETTEEIKEKEQEPEIAETTEEKPE